MEDNLFEKFKKVVDRIYEEKIIPRHRDTVIERDDITNLKILLGLYGNDSEMFINSIVTIIK